MEIQEFMNIAIVGAILSVVIELLPKSNPTATKAITLTLAIIVAGGYVWVTNTPYFQTVVTVLGVASIVYGFFIKK